MNPRTRRRLRRATAWVAACGVLVLLLANRWVINSTHAYIHSNASLLPENEVALVLGCSPYVAGGGDSAQFHGRIRAAAELYTLGKVKRIILSGANPDSHYNEPKKMREALLERGVPDEAITLDFAGDRTLDSIVRAHTVAGLTRFTIVTQRYHAYRATFLARKLGMQAVAYQAPADDAGAVGFRHPPREVLARTLAVSELLLSWIWPGFSGIPG
ncbi:MAG TPA: ElyC/SanA/YdcF family protein [Candidatus Binatia bacterium]|nr:ElyC/SanA/YdcF family protein [Candidatus Binatia bacterium]